MLYSFFYKLLHYKVNILISGSRLLIKDKTNNIFVWMKFLVIILVGHILIDFLGNGVRLVRFFYPFMKEAFLFHIINKFNVLFILFLLVSLFITLFNSKKRRWGSIFLLIIFIYFGALTASKLQLEYSLQEKYNNEILLY
ncbi:transmembrane protein [Gracilibacillus halophilus YIM-C55.5]|uniref:Transmembrane protein n=1 Tax=Gracilibacillus halophilus YIM-C55.5 TaxID=1308866 RepID=N4WRL5_9BACI|nr:transmembrane protein [Gracilibacillus halophilus YIM-C55.5]